MMFFNTYTSWLSWGWGAINLGM